MGVPVIVVVVIDAKVSTYGATTVLASKVTAVCANSLPLIDAPVLKAIFVLPSICQSTLY